MSKLKQNPSLLGNLKGIGFGKLLGINQSRKDAISNLAVIAKRFKDYQQGAEKMPKLQDKLITGNYDKLVKNLSAEIALLTNSLPSKYEQSFLAQVNLLQKEGKLTIENLAAIVKEDELQGLIYEYYNYINDVALERSVTTTNIQGKNQKAAAEVSWQEKLTSAEAEYYMQYAEKTGKGGSPHEFLKVKDALYRDTLVAIAVNSKIKDPQPLKLPELIQELQNEYEQKQRASSYINAGRSFGEADHYQSHITNLEAYGSDRVELYQIMVRDVNLLHQEQLSRRGVRTTQTQQQAIYQEIYQQITTYQVKQVKGQATHKLDYDDQIKIARQIYDSLCSQKWWQDI